MSRAVRLHSFARRHPRWMQAALLALAFVVTVLLLAQPDQPVILYQEF